MLNPWYRKILKNKVKTGQMLIELKIHLYESVFFPLEMISGGKRNSVESFPNLHCQMDMCCLWI